MKEKILFFTAYVPNEAAAGEKNSMLLIKDLSKYYDVDLIYFKYRNQSEYKPVNEYIHTVKVFNNSKFIKIRNILSLPFFHPFFTVRFNFYIKRWLQNHVNNNHYKAIIFDHSQVMLYARFIKTSALKILYSQDVMYQRIGRSQNFLLAKLCKYTEAYCFKTTNSCVFAISDKDANLIEKFYSIKSEYSVAYIDDKILEAYPKIIDNSFVFIGKWARADNLDGVIWFFKKVVPLIKEKIKIILLGRDFPKEKITNTNPLVEIEIPGFVDNPYPMIANCKAMLSPLFSGAGVKQKVLESLACGTPVIGSDIAFEGISQDYSQFMILAEKPEEFAKAISDISFSVEQRCALKDQFLKNYSSATITNYLLKKE